MQMYVHNWFAFSIELSVYSKAWLPTHIKLSSYGSQVPQDFFINDSD